MKILQIVPQFPFPEDDGGKIGIANIFKQFSSQGADVTLFSLNCAAISQNAIDDAKQYGDVILFNKDTKNTPQKIAKSLLTNTSIYMKKHINKELIEEVKKLINIHKYDVIHTDHTCMAPVGAYFQAKYNLPFGLRLHNIEYKIWQRYASDLANPFAKLYISNQAKLLKKEETKLINKANVCFAITEDDREAALEMSPKANIIVASAGVDTDIWQSGGFEQRNPNNLILATTYKWVHNANALRWFLEKVLPKLHAKNPNIKMFIVGKNPPDWVNKFHNIGAVSKGYLDDIKPLMRECGIYIAPLFVGSGIRIKILEAMAMELPVVATSISAEGIKAGENEGLFIANNENDYSDKILKLIHDSDLRKNTGKAAKNFAYNHFNWQKNVKKMLDEYTRIINKY